MTALSLHHVSKVYPSGVRALDDVSLDVGAGEWLVLVGPSGCGKTTLLRAVAGLEAATGGEVRLAGHVVNGVPAHQRGVSMVFQRPSLVGGLSVRENLAWPFTLRRRNPLALLARLAGASRLPADVQRELGEIATLLGLDGLLDRRADELSGGQQQRVVLGRSMLRRAPVRLLDEPLGHLDAPLRAQLRRELRLLGRRFPATTLYVTHDPGEAVALGERVAVMSGGKVQQTGPVDDVRRRPASRFVAEFFGADRPINFLEGQLLDDGGETFLTGTWGRWPVPAAVREGLRDVPAVTAGVPAQDVIADFDGSFGRGLCIIHPADVLLCEPAPDGWWATCEHNGVRMTAHSARALAPGQLVKLMLSLDRAFWFHPVTGATLVAPAG